MIMIMITIITCYRFAPRTKGPTKHPASRPETTCAEQSKRDICLSLSLSLSLSMRERERERERTLCPSLLDVQTEGAADETLSSPCESLAGRSAASPCGITRICVYDMRVY